MLRRLTAPVIVLLAMFAAIACEGTEFPANGQVVVIDGTTYVAYQATPTPIPATATPRPTSTVSSDPVAQQMRDIVGVGEMIVESRYQFEVFAESAGFNVNLNSLSGDTPHAVKVKVLRHLNAADWEERWILDKDVAAGDALIQTRLPGPATYRFTLEGIPDDMRWEVRIR